MNKVDIKKSLVKLIFVSIVCAIPMLTVYGQETAPASELTITSIAVKDLSNFSSSKIIGKDGEKEISIENVRNGFDVDISVQSVDIDVDKDGIRSQGGSNVLIAYVEHDSKPFFIKLEVGIKLKYKLLDGKPVIMFDELYCLANEVTASKPADFDTSQYTSITLKELDTWEKGNSGENGRFKASVYHCQIDGMMRMMLSAADDYFFSTTTGQGAEAVQFKSEQKWPVMRNDQKVVIYFSATSKGAGRPSFEGRILEYIDLNE